jgi:hypothetical protein
MHIKYAIYDINKFYIWYMVGEAVFRQDAPLLL